MNTEQKLDREISSLIRSFDREKKRKPATGKISYRRFLSDKMMIISVINKGVPYSLFCLIKDTTPFSDLDWAKFLHISTKSLHRFKQEARRFKPLQSEKIIELAEVAQTGKEVFGEMDKFKLWLDTPNYSFRNAKPIDLLRDSYGKEMVLGELNRINYGIMV